MRLKFNKLNTTSKTIGVSFNGGKTFQDFEVQTLLREGLTFTKNECRELSKIRIDRTLQLQPRFTDEMIAEFAAEDVRIERVTFDKLQMWIRSKNACTKDEPYKCLLSNFTQKNLVDSKNSYSIGNKIKANTRAYFDFTPTILDVEYLDIYSFYGCANLTGITLGNNIKEIGDFSFQGCTSLKELKIPESTYYIGRYCFYNSGLEHVELPSAIDEILPLTFMYCKNLKEVRLPSAIKSIGISAFRGCKSLKTIYFDGSEEDWNNINFGENWNLGVSNDVKIVFAK